jgi:predicted MFS family arabinose efflux permease
MLTAGRAGQRLPVALALWSSAVFALQIGVARLGYGLALPAIRETLHGNYTLYGTINAISLGGYMAGALIAPLLIGRVRARVLVSSIVGAAALVISAFAADTLVFSLARTVFGFTSGVSLVCAAVETLEAVDASRRGGVSAVMWGGIGIGLLLSAIAASWLVHGTEHWRVASLATGVLMAVAGIGYGISFHRERAGAISKPVAQNQRLQLRNFFFLCLAYVGFGFAYIAYATFIVASIDARLGPHGAETTIQLLWAVYGVASVIGTIAIGRILNRPIGRWALVLVGIAGAAGCAAAFIAPLAVIPSAFVVGLGLTATPAAATAFARARSTTASATTAMAIVTVAVGMGQLIGPIIAGISADRLGLGSVVVVAGCAYLFSTGCAIADVFSTRASAI